MLLFRNNRYFVYRPGASEETSQCACGNEAGSVGSCGATALPQLYAVRAIGCYLPEVANAETCSGHWLAETETCVPTCRTGSRLSPLAAEVSCAQKSFTCTPCHDGCDPHNVGNGVCDLACAVRRLITQLIIRLQNVWICLGEKEKRFLETDFISFSALSSVCISWEKFQLRVVMLERQ